MSKFILIIISIVLLIGIFSVVVSFTSKKIETPSYTILKKYDAMEIRLYPKMIYTIFCRTYYNNFWYRFLFSTSRKRKINQYELLVFKSDIFYC
jgi:hypothetical protein